MFHETLPFHQHVSWCHRFRKSIFTSKGKGTALDHGTTQLSIGMTRTIARTHWNAYDRSEKSEKFENNPHKIHDIGSNEVGILYQINCFGIANKPIIWNAVQWFIHCQWWKKLMRKDRETLFDCSLRSHVYIDFDMRSDKRSA